MVAVVQPDRPARFMRVETVAEILERTAGRTIFTCHHPSESRRVYDNMCEICWECRAVRGKSEFGKRWLSRTLIQHPDRTMTTLDGRPVAHDWNMPPLNSPPSPRTQGHTQTT